MPVVASISALAEGKITMYVRMEDQPPFALTVSKDLLPEHLEAIARSYSREQLGLRPGNVARYVLVRRCTFSNADQLLDFKLLPAVRAAGSTSGSGTGGPAGERNGLGGEGPLDRRRSNSVSSVAAVCNTDPFYGANGGSSASFAYRSPSVMSYQSTASPQQIQPYVVDQPAFIGKNFAFVDVSPVYGAVAPSMDVVRREFHVTEPGSAATLSPYPTQLSVVALHRLVLLVTDPTMDFLYGEILILFHRQFATTDELLERLMERYDVPPIVAPGQPERSPLDRLYYAEVRRRVQVRVMQLLERWVQRYSPDFADSHTNRRLREWAMQKVDKAGAPPRILHLLDAVDCTPLHARKPTLLPGVPRRGLTVTAVLMRYSPQDVATQLTILAQCVHSKLTAPELIGRRWETDEAALVPNFILYRDFFARVSNWATYAVVSERDLPRRTANLSHMLYVCDELARLRNWDMLVAVYGGLTDASVKRLERTWSGLSDNARALSDNLQELLASTASYRTLKDTILASEKPHFPCIAIFFKELRALEDEPVSRQGQVNFLRCIKEYQLITMLLAGKDAVVDGLVPISEVQGAFSLWREVDAQTLMNLSVEIEES